MRITRIDFEGKPGHYATAQRRDGMHNGPDIILVTILTPDTPNGREHHVRANCDEDIRSIAERLRHHLDSRRGPNSTTQDYYLLLLQLSDCRGD